MEAKDNLLNFYLHKRIEIMPIRGEGEIKLDPITGFEERPAGGRGGFDWFGCKWEYTEGEASATPDPQYVALKDIRQWREIVKFPDLDAWDWEQAAKRDNVAGFNHSANLLHITSYTGFFERLHALMGFEEALCALLEETDEVAAFLDAFLDYKMKLVDKLMEYYKPDVITFHDDWGTQIGPFFSPVLWRELIKPRLSQLVAHVHSYKIPYIQHSCGKFDDLIPDIAETGVDVLQCMDINDIGAALKKTGDKMSYFASVHSQDFFAADAAGKLTPEMVREEVHREFMEWGATGYYAPFILPSNTWYGEIINEEFRRCREEVKGTY